MRISPFQKQLIKIFESKGSIEKDYDKWLISLSHDELMSVSSDALKYYTDNIIGYNEMNVYERADIVGVLMKKENFFVYWWNKVFK